MRFLVAVLLVLCFVSSSLAMFRSSSRQGMATVDATSGDVVWVPMPRQVAIESEYTNRRCVFCRGYTRR